MSGANAALSLPPGDRDDAPFLPPERTGAADAGRIPASEADPTEHVMRRISTQLDDAATALASLRNAHAAGDAVTAAAAAWRLNEALTLVDVRMLSADLRRQLVARQMLDRHRERASARQSEET